MEYFEFITVGLGFLAIGIPAGYFAFLIFRISIHQNKFEWAGALSIVTTLCGGGFLTYQSRPLHFGLYAIGFLIGFLKYLRYLTNKNSGDSDYISSRTLGSAVASTPSAEELAEESEVFISHNNQPTIISHRDNSISHRDKFISHRDNSISHSHYNNDSHE